MIDDGARGGQNAAATLSETIRCIGLDYVPQTAAVLVEEVQQPYRQMQWDTSWLVLQMAIEDLPEAFRGVPLHPDDQHACVVWFFIWCFVSGEGWLCGAALLG